MRRRLIRIILGLFIVVLFWSAMMGIFIWNYGSHDHAIHADCIIVLGAAVQGDAPSPVFEERIRHGISLYKAGYAPKLLFTGGVGDGQIYSEGSIGRAMALQQGIPVADVLVEEKSRTTQQNLSEASAVMGRHQMKSAIVVSDPLHMKRATMMANDLGIVAVSSPTPTSRYRSLKVQLAFLTREIYFIHHYVVTGH